MPGTQANITTIICSCSGSILSSDHGLNLYWVSVAGKVIVGTSSSVFRSTDYTSGSPWPNPLMTIGGAVSGRSSGLSTAILFPLITEFVLWLYSSSISVHLCTVVGRYVQPLEISSITIFLPYIGSFSNLLVFVHRILCKVLFNSFQGMRTRPHYQLSLQYLMITFWFFWTIPNRWIWHQIRFHRNTYPTNVHTDHLLTARVKEKMKLQLIHI